MKNIFLILCFIITFLSNAQNSFFVDKKGKKVIMRDDSVEFIVVDKRIAYAENGKTWEKYIRFKDLNYAIFGNYYFKGFRLITPKGKKKNESAYFVMVETETKKLLCYTYTVISKYNSTDYYNIYVIDNNSQILDYVELSTSNVFINARAKITPFINKHFSECSLIMNEFNKYSDNDDKHLNVLGFFNTPTYSKCN